MEGTIPITHIRLIYDDSSDDEGKRCHYVQCISCVTPFTDADRYAAPIAQDDRLYDGK